MLSSLRLLYLIRPVRAFYGSDKKTCLKTAVAAFLICYACIKQLDGLVALSAVYMITPRTAVD